jgi:2,3-bisphosphoglycerate-dependent phosphoglycerate mutase
VAEPRVFRQSRYQPPPGAAELVLVRHGESEPLVEGTSFPLVDGHGDPALAPEGEAQAERVAQSLAGEPIAAIYVTTLRRTAQTAAPLARRLGLIPAVEADLREVHLGDWEGELFRQKVADGDPVARQMAAEQRWEVIPGAEPADVFGARVRRGVERIAAAHPDQRVVVVAHGGTIGEVLAQATGSRPWAFVGADNGSVSRLVVSPDRWTLRSFNDTHHLLDP